MILGLVTLVLRRLAISGFFFGGLFCGAACGPAPTLKSAKGPASTATTKEVEPRTERILVRADRIAFVEPEGNDPNGAVPSLVVLGRQGTGARVLFHFEVTLPAKGMLRSAAILLTRSSDVDMAPSPVELHAERIVDPWDARLVSWPEQPRLVDARTPHVLVRRDGAKTVRVDVTNIVQGWPLKDPSDQGVALVADSSTMTGAAFSYISRADDPPALEVVWAYPGEAPATSEAQPDNRPKNRLEPAKKDGLMRIEEDEQK
ncbi:MAG: DNRLRE domain-containing protein [Polyangiaceae bacterium]